MVFVLTRHTHLATLFVVSLCDSDTWQPCSLWHSSWLCHTHTHTWEPVTTPFPATPTWQPCPWYSRGNPCPLRHSSWLCHTRTRGNPVTPAATLPVPATPTRWRRRACPAAPAAGWLRRGQAGAWTWWAAGGGRRCGSSRTRSRLQEGEERKNVIFGRWCQNLACFFLPCRSSAI